MLSFEEWVLADPTATQYDWLLTSSRRLSVPPSVRPSVCNAVHGSVYMAKSCTSVFLAGKLLFVPSDTFTVGCVV